MIAPRFRRVEVIHLGHVAARAVEEDDDRLLAQRAADGPLHEVDPIGGEAARRGGAVAGEVDDAAQELPDSLHTPMTPTSGSMGPA